MEQLSRVYLYRNMEEEDIAESLQFTMKINLKVLEGVEEFFLTSEIGNESIEFDYSDLLERIRSNIQQLSEWTQNESWEYNQQILKEKLMNILHEYERKSGKNGRNLFNKIINELGEFNGKIIEKKDFDVNAYPRGERPQVFLSHAYVDKTYTWRLFYYFYSRGIYLYVDWMHKTALKDGRDIKSGLREELNKSSQLLFLRTLNSELDIQGKQYLKPWCSWELGGFYNGHSPNEKYLLNLYSVDGYKNVQLHGLKLFTGIVGQRLHGIEITP